MGVTKFDHGKKVYATDVDGFPDEFLAAQKRVGEHFVTLKDGRKLCYMADGDPTGVPMICMHGGSEGKYMFLQKEPLPGIYMISIDRCGYGKSDGYEPPEKYDFKMIAKDVEELANQLRFGQIILCGFSIGTSWAMQIGCQLKARVRGVLLFGSMADTFHPKCTKEQASKIGRPPAILDPVSGMCGCFLRSVFKWPVKAFKKGDYKMAFEKEASLGTCSKVWSEFKSDPFWVCCKVASFGAYHDSGAQLGDAYRSLCKPWPFDIEQDLKCPVFVFQGAGDYDMGSSAPHVPNFLKQLMPHAEVELVEGCGHVCICGPHDRWRNQVLGAVAKCPPLPGSS